MAKAVPLFSGSKGNSYFLGTATQGVLIDAGRSCKQIENALLTNSIDPRIIGAVFITHEHTDHIQGIPMMTKYFHVPIYGTAGTLDGIRQKDSKGLVTMEHLYQVYADRPVTIGSLEVTPFHMSHDAADPVCYAY